MKKQKYVSLCMYVCTSVCSLRYGKGGWRRKERGMVTRGGKKGERGKGREGIQGRGGRVSREGEGGWRWVEEGRERDGSSMVSCVWSEVGKRGKSSVLMLFEYACMAVGGVEWWKISNIHLPPPRHSSSLALSFPSTHFSSRWPSAC